MRSLLVVVVAVCLLVLFAGLEGTGLVDQREARDAQVATELAESREPLSPILGGQPLFEKPILAYAPEAAVRLTSGAADLRSRQMRAVGALLLLIITASVGAQHFGARAGWFSALVLATTLALPLASRTDGTQLLASVLGWLGAAGLADALFGRRAGRDLRLVVTYGALGAALVCTGLLPALWPIGGLVLYLVLAKTPEGWGQALKPSGLLLMLGLALPWYGAMIERYGEPFLVHAPFFPYGVETRGQWYAGPVLMVSFLVVGLFPWSCLLPGAILHAAAFWRAARGDVARFETEGRVASGDPIARVRHEESASHFFIACLLAALVPIAIYPGPPMPAVLPALPAAALLCGRFLDHLFEDPGRIAAPLGRATLMLALVGTVGAVLLTLVATRLRDAAPELRLLATVVFVTSWAPLLANLLGRRRLAAALMLLPVTLGAPVVTMRLMPAMEGYLNSRQVAEAMTVASPPQAPLVLLEQPPPSLRLYGRRNLVVGVPLERALRRYRAADRLAYVAFRPARERELGRAAKGPIEILIRTPSLILARVHPE